jgi:hypothetical protein
MLSSLSVRILLAYFASMTGGEIMNVEKLLTTLLLLLPGLSWGVPPGSVPEPGILPLLAAGGIVAVAVKFMKRKK